VNKAGKILLTRFSFANKQLRKEKVKNRAAAVISGVTSGVPGTLLF